MDQLLFKFPFSKKYYEQDFFVSNNNFSAYKLLYPYLFRIINKDTARKHHEIMKVVQVNDKITLLDKLMAKQAKSSDENNKLINKVQ